MRITIFDYGAGNLHSLTKALACTGYTVSIQPDPAAALDTDVLVLPGVGAFGAAAARLAPAREAMRDAVRNGLPTIGICLGMQLLLDESDEGAGYGLGVIPGRVTRLCAARVPQIGWNSVAADPSDPVFALAPLGSAYYANSYVCRPDDPAVVSAWSVHEGDRYPAAVATARAVGVQFHPEKSSAAGVRFLHALVARVGRPEGR